MFALDTETTGLPTTRKGPTDLPTYDTCRLVSVGIVEFDDSGEEIGNFHMLVKPEGYIITGTDIHGISDKDCHEHGIPFQEVYDNLQFILEGDPLIVGHNLQFDMNVLLSECHRAGLEPFPFRNTNCTLELCKKILKKSMKLGPLYKHLTGESLIDAHSAVPDARASGIVWRHLMNPRLLDEPKTITPKKIWIKVSDVAACIGQHPYKRTSEVMDYLLEKYNPEKYHGLTRETKQKELIGDHPVVNSIVNEASGTLTSNSIHVNQVFDATKCAINRLKCITPEEKVEVCDYIRKTIFTNHGINREDLTSDKFDGNLKKDDTFYKQLICELNGTQYYLCGRIDRLREETDGSYTLVEIKNRTKALFNVLKNYEFIQVHTYLGMTKLQKGLLVEQFDDDLRTYEVGFSSTLFQEHLSGLKDFCKALHYWI